MSSDYIADGDILIRLSLSFITKNMAAHTRLLTLLQKVITKQ